MRRLARSGEFVVSPSSECLEGFREGTRSFPQTHAANRSPRPCRLHLHPARCGGSEGLVMLNRTLSANLNGLNFGTRTLANLAGLNIVATQGLRHAHPRKRKDSMRDMD